MPSYCTRLHHDGQRVILPDELDQYLEDGHLCSTCAGESDSEYAQRTVASHRQSTVPEVVT